MFRKISVSKQAISLAFMFVRMVRCFITNIRHSSVYAENIVIMQRMQILGNYVDPHPVRCHVYMIQNLSKERLQT